MEINERLRLHQDDPRAIRLQESITFLLDVVDYDRTISLERAIMRPLPLDIYDALVAGDKQRQISRSIANHNQIDLLLKTKTGVYAVSTKSAGWLCALMMFVWYYA